jgi:hypothetical protein
MNLHDASGLPPLGADEDGWDRYYRAVIRETGREVDERLLRVRRIGPALGARPGQLAARGLAGRDRFVR